MPPKTRRKGDTLKLPTSFKEELKQNINEFGKKRPQKRFKNRIQERKEKRKQDRLMKKRKKSMNFKLDYHQQLEKKLGFKPGGKLPKAFIDDGLDELLDGIKLGFELPCKDISDEKKDFDDNEEDSGEELVSQDNYDNDDKPEEISYNKKYRGSKRKKFSK
nr:7406_t:CDS:2 [Entrophospora candida]